MKLASLSATVTLFALLALGPGVAHAGGCTPCTTSQECVDAFGAPAFCIEWTDGATACPGTAMPARGCCPGQGCATFSGRPSCEGEGRCTVVDEVDAGIVGVDAGPGTDAGPGIDGGGTATDAGTGRGPSRSGGCGCRAGGGSDASLGAFALGLLVLGLVARRSRRG